MTKPAPNPADAAVSAIPNDMLLNSIPLRLVGTAAPQKASLLEIRDVYRKQDTLFVWYTIENRSEKTFRTGTPTVVSLSAPRYD
ncbi:MAG: hypothetical protein ACR2OE_01620, partial [Thermomicrobiales bacterium]